MLVEGSTTVSEIDYLERLRRVRSDPWYFLSNMVYTKDEVDKNNSIKKFPSDRLYLKLYVRLWEREPLIAVPKSRRMYMSWTNIALYTWDTMWNIGRNNAFVSKKEEDSADLVQRANFIYEHLDTKFLPKEFLPKAAHTYGKLVFPDMESKIEGYAQGADQLRQFTFSGILADEMAFWPDAQKMYATSVPTLEGGGRFTAISSPGPGFFKRLVFDQLDQDRGEE
jgi:hypothetical protein